MDQRRDDGEMWFGEPGSDYEVAFKRFGNNIATVVPQLFGKAKITIGRADSSVYDDMW